MGNAVWCEVDHLVTFECLILLHTLCNMTLWTQASFLPSFHNGILFFYRLVEHLDKSISLYLALAFTFNFVVLCLLLYMTIWEYYKIKDDMVIFLSAIMWLLLDIFTFLLKLIIAARVNSMVSDIFRGILCLCSKITAVHTFSSTLILTS